MFLWTYGVTNESMWVTIILKKVYGSPMKAFGLYMQTHSFELGTFEQLLVFFVCTRSKNEDEFK
jgi:hypothetical protein